MSVMNDSEEVLADQTIFKKADKSPTNLVHFECYVLTITIEKYHVPYQVKRLNTVTTTWHSRGEEIALSLKQWKPAQN